MPGRFVHDIDPVLFSVWGVHAWWYGLSYSLGFVSAHLALRRNRKRLGLSMSSVYEMTLLLAAGVLAGGTRARGVQRVGLLPRAPVPDPRRLDRRTGDSRPHRRRGGRGPALLPACAGSRSGRSSTRSQSPRPSSWASGRIGNFIDGQIVGSVTTVPWAVQFPEAEGFRHPVLLYDGLKNFALIPILLCVRRRGVPPGRLAALFVVLYAGLRIPIDLLREYPLTLGGLPSGQMVNVIMAVCGAALLLKNWLLPAGRRRAGLRAGGRRWATRLAAVGLRGTAAPGAGHPERRHARRARDLRSSSRRAGALAGLSSPRARQR